MAIQIEVRNLRRVYRIGEQKVIALNHIDLLIPKGEICCILGTSGSGKSTLLNMFAGLERPSRGEIKLGGRHIETMSEAQLALFRQKYIGFIFQAYYLLPDMTALENVCLPLMFRGIPKKQREVMGKKLLEDVGLGKYVHHKPTEMSGGQQQRVGIARAFVSHPQLVLADEPTGNLDTATSLEVMQQMVHMAHYYDQTLVVVTHDVELAEFADRVLYLRDGKIERDEHRIYQGDREA